jgi:hypothetical protein
MPSFKLSSSGNVLQAFNPSTAFTSPVRSPMGLFNVAIGQSSQPVVEADMLQTQQATGSCDALDGKRRPHQSAILRNAGAACRGEGQAQTQGIAPIRSSCLLPDQRPRPIASPAPLPSRMPGGKGGGGSQDKFQRTHAHNRIWAPLAQPTARRPA